MSDVWSGTYTFLLSDIVGSTRLWEYQPAEMARALAAHDDILTHVVTSHGGRLIRSRGEGDSAFAVFDDPRAAVECGVELQRTLHKTSWPTDTPVLVRVALHSGPAQSRRNDYFGPSVNRAARLRSIAHGGQLIVSADVHDAVASKLPHGAWLADLGLHRLKDLQRPERVWQVGHTDLPTEFPPLLSLDARGNNLPVQPTVFVGRDDELRDVRKRLETSSLITLVGPGGIGKTRLALQVAAESSESFPDGVWLVELADVTDPGLVPQAISSVLAVREEPGRALTDSLANHISSRRMLLVLDNCEHVIDGAAQIVAELMRKAGDLRVLATSREPLRAYGEAVYAVPTMAVPERDDAFPEEAMSSEAVRLFADRAELADRSFALSGAVEHVVGICRRLEGIPLAIELAAALVATSPPAQLARRLEDRFGALDEGPRTAPARQRTLRAAIEWSHQLLDDVQRTLFARLSVFAGGCTADAVRSVAAMPPLTATLVDVVLQQLADRSLLFVRDDSGDTRYAMLETLREFAADSLRSSGEEADIGKAHVAWCRSYLPEATELHGATATAALARIDAEHDNVRAALNRSISSEDEESTTDIMNRLFYFWFVRAHFREGRSWLDRAVAMFTDSKSLGRWTLQSGQLAAAHGEAAEATRLAQEAATAARSAGDRLTLSAALTTIATAAFQSGRLDEADAAASEALSNAREMDVPRLVVPPLNLLGVVSAMKGDNDAARSYYLDALAVSREGELRENISRVLMNLGNIDLARSEYPSAARYYEECRTEALAIGDVQTASGALTNLGVVANMSGEPDRARELFHEALVEKRRIGDGNGLVAVLQSLADLDRRSGKFGDAIERLTESVELARELPYALGLIQGLEAYGSIFTDAERDPVTGLRMLAAASAARTSAGFRRNPEDTVEFDRALAILKERVADDERDRIWKEGSSLDLFDAAAEAIEVGRR